MRGINQLALSGNKQADFSSEFKAKVGWGAHPNRPSVATKLEKRPVRERHPSEK